MAKFTFTATAPGGETRTRKSENLYTHASVRGGQVISFHQSEDIARRAAAKVRGTTIVEVTGCAKAEAFLAERRIARAQKVLEYRDFGLGDQVTGYETIWVDGRPSERRTVVGELVTVIQPPHRFVEAGIREGDGTETSINLLRVKRA